jgi:membrane protein required for beta-lactamase induction
VYAAWAILSWFIFTYGLLIYNLLGSSTESSFVRSWLIALGVDNAKQWQDILRAALQSAALMFVLDRMWIMSNAAWLEQHVDFMSVQATLLTAVPTTFVKRVRRHLDYYAATK